MRAKNRMTCKQEIAEIGGVERREPLLISAIKLHALAVAEGACPRPAAPCRARGRDSSSRRSTCAKCAGGPALLVEVLRRDHLFQQADLIIRVEDGETRT